MYCLFLVCVEYASDQEWSRYLFLFTICWCGLVGFLIADYLFIVGNLNYMKTATVFVTGAETCKQFFEVNIYCNLVVAVLISLLSLLQIIHIFITGKNFFMKKHVVHTASCFDDDIIVYG
jgi:hypothetical protein